MNYYYKSKRSLNWEHVHARGAMNNVVDWCNHKRKYADDLINIDHYEEEDDPRYKEAVKALQKHIHRIYVMMMEVQAVALSYSAENVDENIKRMKSSKTSDQND